MSQRPNDVFKSSAFRSLWFGALVMNLALFMQSTGAAWLMVSLTPSPMLVALMQTAAALPGFLFSLPGVVLADLVDRRRMLLATQTWLLGCAALLAALSYGGWMTPFALLVMTSCLGIGSAIQTPAWHTSQAEAVTRSHLPMALALSATSYNAARAVGPALAGLLAALGGVSTVFAASALGFGASLISLLGWKRGAVPVPNIPETLGSGMLSAFRYVRHSTVVGRQLLRTSLFTCSASGLWALMPLLARHELGFGASGYGLMLGSFGGGAILGAVCMHALRAHAGLNGAANGCVATYALAVLVVSLTDNHFLIVPTLIVAGACWMIVGNTNLSAIQTSIPSWVRARVMALYLLTFQGAMALGGACWGAVASSGGTRAALGGSVVFVLVALLVMRRIPARIGHESETMTSAAQDLPSLIEAADPDDGPVAIETTYRIRPEIRRQFVQTMQQLGSARRRDGATAWRLYRDLKDDDVYVERFLIDSWAEFIRHRGRTTIADQEVHEMLLPMTVQGSSPRTGYFVAARNELG